MFVLQARKAFAVYLHCILQRLSDFDPENGDQNQIDLVLKFLQKVRVYKRVSLGYPGCGLLAEIGSE